MSRHLLLALALAGCKSGTDVTCGAGTVLTGSECLALDAAPTPSPSDARYEIRITDTQIGANGHTRRRVLALGTLPDGSPATDAVVIALDRASAGTLGDTDLVLGAQGVSTAFTPCDQTSADCLGPATLTLALASAPTMPIAHVDIQLVVPTEVSTATPCIAGGTVLYVDGDGSIHFDMYRLEAATWIHENSDPGTIYLFATPNDPLQGVTWALDFLAGQAPLAVQTYTVQTPFGPKLDVGLNGVPCQPPGAFQVHDVVNDVDGHAKAFTISFEGHCGSTPTALLEGCVRYETP